MSDKSYRHYGIPQPSKASENSSSPAIDVKDCLTQYQAKKQNCAILTPKHILLNIICTVTFHCRYLVGYVFDSQNPHTIFHTVMQQAKDYFKPINRVSLTILDHSNPERSVGYISIIMDRPFKCNSINDLPVNVNYLIGHIFKLFDNPDWRKDIEIKRIKKIKLNQAISTELQ